MCGNLTGPMGGRVLYRSNKYRAPAALHVTVSDPQELCAAHTLLRYICFDFHYRDYFMFKRELA